MGLLTNKLFLLVVFVGGLAFFFGLGHESQYIFKPAVLHEVAKAALKAHPNDIRSIVHQIAAELHKRYPGHINLDEEWIFNNAGGAMGAMYLLHSSLTEYVIIFGTPIGTEGHTGRFLADDYFIILDGEQWAFSEGSLEREVFKPGTMHHLARGSAKAYRAPDHVWALEYARGNIPAMLPFGLADTLTSTLDIHTLINTFRIYGKLVIKELLQGKI